MTYWHSAYRNHGPAILAYLKSRTRPEIAEDLLQETFVRAIRAGEIPEKLRPYLLTIAHNLMINTYRKKRIPLFSEVGEGHDSPVARTVSEEQSPEKNADLSRLQMMLDDAISQLSQDQRRAFQLAVLEQQPYKEVARRTGWSLSRVKTNIFRARQSTINHLRVLLREPAA